ncbi:hypothetical protein VDG04_17305, partial [Xanthomonas campestris pv. raphani]|nr:hypothetical protein [Xanthomonas campestris pv. raphani]
MCRWISAPEQALQVALLTGCLPLEQIAGKQRNFVLANTAQRCSLDPIPDSRFPIPDSRFPIPDSRFPIPD